MEYIVDMFTPMHRVSQVTELMTKNKAVRARCVLGQSQAKLTLPSLLIMPVQRIPR